jgi:hypothetical protein
MPTGGVIGLTASKMCGSIEAEDPEFKEALLKSSHRI